jgi:hypothetical protein
MIPLYIVLTIAVLIALSAAICYLLKDLVDEARERRIAENSGYIGDDDEWEDEE